MFKQNLIKAKAVQYKELLHLIETQSIDQIQVGDRYYACVASDDLSPPEGQECEKRVIKRFDKSNSLPAR